MAAGRLSSMPSRLRQLLSGEGSTGPSIKLDAEPPPDIKSFIDKVIQSPLSDIAIPLSGFRWQYSKGNFHHWRPLFLHFDKYFKTYLSNRNDLLLSDEVLEGENSFPKLTVLQILRAMQIILENSPNKSSFDGLEHFKLLLASTDPEVLIAALETLSALVKISPSKLRRRKMIGCGSVNSFLLSIAQGWGSKEEGLGLYSCIVANEKKQEEGLSLFPSDLKNNQSEVEHRIDSTLYFELHGHSAQKIDNGTSASSCSRVIQIPDMHTRKEDDLVLMKQCIDLHNVPPDLRFSLLTRIRYAHAFRSSRICRLYSRICLLAFIVLVQSSDAQDELASFFANEPEYTNELIRIVRSEEPIPGTIRTLAMLALRAQLAVYAASHDRARILSGSSISFTVGNRMILLNVLQKAVLSLKISSDPSSIAFAEALLQFYLLHIVSSSSSGSTIRGSEMVPTFLPLLEFVDPSHIHLVYLAVKALHKLMDYSSSAVPLLRDLGGVELLSHRLEVEVHHILGLPAEVNSDMLVGESLINVDQVLSRKRLIKVLLKSLGSAAYTPGNANRSQSSHECTLPATLSLIYKNASKFGDDIYYSSVTVMSDIIHKDPTSLTSLFEMGLPDAFLSSVTSGILPSSKALACIPNGLGAICLNSRGLVTIKKTSALRFLVDIFTSKKYVSAMNEAIVPFANAMEELLRHVTSLRKIGVEIIIEIVNKIACFGETGSSSSSVNLSESTTMEMDSDLKETPGVSHEQFIQLSIYYLIILLHRIMENSETSRIFVEKSGIEALLKLLLRPSIAQSSEGISIALQTTLVFKDFTQQHSSSLARAFCSSLRDQLRKALEGLQDLSETVLLDQKHPPSSGTFATLFLVEFLLFLAASKDNRWMSALILEFANGHKDVLDNIGHLQREILWHLAFHEGATLESQNKKTGLSSESEQGELGITATEGQRFNSFRRFLDPSFRRTAGGSAESQLFDLINLYHGRASTGLQPRPITDGPSSSSDVSGKREHEKGGSYYASCCDLVKSLSFHITYIFQELGKAMLLPSRRRDDITNVSPSAKLVASTFASISLDHLSFGGHEIAIEASVSTKCRYLGKVVDFIDAILLDRPDSCNPVLINCFYSRGVIQKVLTTYDATSQLLFAINRNCSSLMEIDDVKGKDEKEDTDHAWIYGSLASYGKLMDHLVTSSFILSPPTKHLLVQPVESGSLPFPQDAETFVKTLQSIVLKAVLPVWTHPKFTECSYDYVTTLISIIKHVYSGVELKNLGGSGSARVTGPPPSETTILTIVEMGFSRSRAEEALRQVRSNSVELAMEWLFSHPEEFPEDDDELACALAMSLGNSESDTTQKVADECQQQIETELVSLPPVEELITTCTELLQMNETLAFPVRDLLVLICSENNGEHRSGVISCLLSRIKDCSPVSDDTKNNLLSALLHVLALILHEDADSREVALKAGIVRLVCDVLSKWDSGNIDNQKIKVPKWVMTGFLSIDRLLQVDQKLNTELLEELKKGDTSLTIDESKQEKLQSVFGSPQLVDVDDQKKLIKIACTCIRNHLPSETMHAVLQLCSTLTRKYSLAFCFLDFGGVQALLSLPSSSLFPGFDSVAASIIRHVLEDPQTLQQAMESEIKHALATLSNRQSNPRISPRNFLLGVNSVIARDPVTFIQAARSICQVEMVGERPYIVLLKEKEKSKEKERDKDKTEKEKSQTSYDEKLTTTPAPGNTKAPKVHRKPPQSFIGVVELLLDSICNFVPPKDDMVEGDSTLADMDIDIASTKGKGKAVAPSPEEKEANSQDMSASLAKMVFILKLLSEILLLYSSSIHIILRRDTEMNSLRGPQQKSGQVDGLFHHILHEFIPCSRVKKEKKLDSDRRQKLASKGNQFLVGASIRSAEARKRIFSDISSIFNGFIDTCNGFRPPVIEIQILIDLLSDMLSARSPTGSHISSEASATFVDVGLVKSLTRTLEVLDLDNVDSPKAVTGIIKVLEVVTKEHVRSADSNSKDENANKSCDQIQSGRGDTTVHASQAVERTLGSNDDSTTANHVENSAALTDDMEHDQDLNEGFAPADDDYMEEAAEDARGLENGVGSLGIEFEMHTHPQENLDEEEDEEMSGDEGDEIDEDENNNEEEDEEDNDLEENDVHHLPHHDTDQDDLELDDEEFEEEEVLVEEDEEEEDDEDRVIPRFEDGINGLNVLDHLEVLRDHRFSDEALHVMPVEVFGSRRQGRTTSIYSLLGRTGDGATPSQHPLLSGSASLPSSQTQTVTLRDRLDAIFRSLRSGRNGHRLNLWADDNQQIVGSGASAVPHGLEDLLVSQLRRPSSDKPSDQNSSLLEHQSHAESAQAQEATIGPEIPDENTIGIGDANVSAPSIVSLDASTRPATQATANDSVSRPQSQSVEIQYDQNDSTVRDVEAVSQESGGSGATLGESLRSLDVEIGSADGHDDGAERHEVQPTRSRRANLSLVPSSSGREASLNSVTEVPENSGHNAEQDNPPAEQPVNRDGSSGSIDPAFLDALPEELRAEVLSAQQEQVPQPSSSEPQSSGDIDPEFLAALPPDIRAELLAQQQAQRLHQSQELEGQPVEMDAVSIIATFPSELREEVLLTSSDAILANLTPALVAEANMLRERFAHRYHYQAHFGMHPRLRRGESSQRGGSVLSRIGRNEGIASRRSASKVIETDGAPLVNTEALQAMIRVLRLVQPLYKGPLQRLLLNLCSHGETRLSLVNTFMDMLMLDTRKPVNYSSVKDPPYRLYACQSYVTYSRPQHNDGVPPLVSRRVLETLIYLARNHMYVAKILLQSRLSLPSLQSLASLDKAHGKAVVVSDDYMGRKQDEPGSIAFALLLSLLNQPLYLRSVSHLEQLLNLLEVIIDSAERKSDSADRSDGSASQPESTPQGLEVENHSENHDNISGPIGPITKPIDLSASSSTREENECDVQGVLLNLRQSELCLLCSLLAREGLSDNAYSLVAEVLKKLVAIAPSHCHLFISELANAIQNLTRKAMSVLHMFGETVKALLSTTSSDGTAILRVLQALSSLIGSLITKVKNQPPNSEEHVAVLSQLSNINSALEPLWLELSSCIYKIEGRSGSSTINIPPSSSSTTRVTGVSQALPAGAQNILPYIESFFVTCEKLHPSQSGTGHDFGVSMASEVEEPKGPGPSSKVDEKYASFTRFSERHRKLLNAFIRQNPTLLEKSFSLMLKVPRFIEFDNKRAYFRSKIKHQHDHHHSPLRISVRRAYILEDSYNQLRMRSTQELKGRLTVHFQGEEGIDAGGLTREWYQLLSRVIFDKGALLFTTVGNDSTFQPNPNSVYQTEHLSYFKFIGRVVGKALFDGQLLDVHFTRSFYKHILGVKVTYHDIEAIDPDYYKNLKWMLEHDISNVLDLTFSIDADEEKLILYEKTEVTDHELIPGGRNIKVTEENKHQYVDLVAEHRLTTAIRPQINAFLEGFSELILKDLISIFNDKELELLISGLPDIDLDDMRANTEYSGYSSGSPVIQWFWEVVQGLSKEDKARLLQFVTGTSKVPLEGFSALQGISGAQKFQIHKAYGSASHLPSAHTCFNQLDLPEYPSKEHLQERLLLAIHEASEGFGFG